MPCPAIYTGTCREKLRVDTHTHKKKNNNKNSNRYIVTHHARMFYTRQRVKQYGGLANDSVKNNRGIVFKKYILRIERYIYFRNLSRQIQN